MLNKINSFLSKYGIWLILLLATTLRFIGLRHGFYGTTSEMYRDLGVEYDLWVGHVFPLIGPSASLGGFNFGPAYYYLIAPLTKLFGLGPFGAILTSAVFSLASVYLAFVLCKLWFKNTHLALLVSFLVSISMFDIQNAHYISNPNPLPFFSLLSFYSATFFMERTAKFYHAIALGLAVGIATQLHGTSLIILPLALAIAFIINKVWRQWRLLLVSILSATITYLPYVAHQLNTNYRDLKGIIFLGGHNFGIVPNINSLVAMFHFFGNTILFKDDYFSLWKIYPVLSEVLLILFISGLVLALMKNKQFFYGKLPIDVTRAGKILMACWIVVTLCIFLFFVGKLPEFYFLVLWPLPLVLLGWLLANLNVKNKNYYYFLISLFCLIQAVQLYFFYPVLEHPEMNHEQLAKAFLTIQADAGEHSYNVLNDTTDLSLFFYYKKFSGLNTKVTKYQPEIIYFINNQSNPQIPILLPTHYSFVEKFISGNSTIFKYKK